MKRADFWGENESLPIKHWPDDAAQSGQTIVHPAAATGKNVVMIAVDDMNAFATMKSLYGGTLSTPNIDRLMAMGTTFENAFATTALCNPSRTSILSGQLPPTSKVFSNAETWFSKVDPNDTVFAPFKNAGYFNAGVGKIFHQITPQIARELFSEYDFNTHSPRVTYPNDPFGIAPFTGDESTMTDDKSAAFAQQFIGNYTGTSPFFLSVGFHKPHTQWHVPQQYYDLYPKDQIVLPAHLNNDRADLPQWALDHFSTTLNSEVRAAGEWKDLLQAYFAAISYVDAQIGKVLDAIASSPYADNTAIVLWSDHGYHLGDKDYWHKFTLWDEAGRAPLIVADPGVTTPGSVVSHTVSMMDIYSTLLDIAGLSPSGHQDSQSLMPLLQNPDADWNEPAYTFMYGSWSVRTDHYRYIHYEDGSEELYDIRSDPHDFNNLASNPAYLSVKTHLLHTGTAYLADHGFIQGGLHEAAVDGTPGKDVIVSPDPDATLAGGAGNDTYFIWNTTQTIHELKGGGTDKAYVDLIEVKKWTMPDNVESVQTNGKSRPDLGLSKGVLIGNAQHNFMKAVGPIEVVLHGMGGSDTLVGSLGDRLAGGADADKIFMSGASTLVYSKASQSNSAAYDTVDGFNADSDKIQLATQITGVAAPVSGQLRSGHLDADLAALVTLGTNQAEIVKATSGNLAGRTFLVIDGDGHAGYTAGADYVIQLTNALHLGDLSAHNFTTGS